MKKLLPVWMKKLPWFLFKSPQRKGGLLSSYSTEIRGALSFLIHFLTFNNKALKPVSICTGIKNRTDNYLGFVLESVLKMDHQELIELSIFDCGSEDVNRFEFA